MYSKTAVRDILRRKKRMRCKVQTNRETFSDHNFKPLQFSTGMRNKCDDDAKHFTFK